MESESVTSYEFPSLAGIYVFLKVHVLMVAVGLVHQQDSSCIVPGIVPLGVFTEHIGSLWAFKLILIGLLLLSKISSILCVSRMQRHKLRMKGWSGVTACSLHA